MSEKAKGHITIYFNDGTNKPLEYEWDADGETKYSIGQIIQKALDARQLIFEMKDSSVAIPFASIKYLEVTPSPTAFA